MTALNRACRQCKAINLGNLYGWQGRKATPMTNMQALRYPERKKEIRAFIDKHHYSHRSLAVWQYAYALTNRRGAICGVAVYGQPPYPSIKRAFCRRPEDEPRLIWQARMVAAGVSRSDLDGLLAFASEQLRDLGYWYLLTLTERKAWVIDNTVARLVCPGFSGATYARNGWLWLGTTQPSHTELFVLDGHRVVHVRQNRITLTRSNIHQHFPEAHEIRAVPGAAKDRWAQVLAYTEQQYSERLLLMKYHPQPWEPVTQPRLFARRFTQGVAVAPAIA